MPVTDYTHYDQIGSEWLADAQAALASGQQPGALPAWESPHHVTGDVLGQYVYDPRTNTVHHVMGSHPDCGIDTLNPRVFVHFWTEVRQHYPQAQACDLCEW